MLPLHLFKKRAFTGVQLAALGVSASIFALFLYLTLYLQGFLGHDPLEAGLRYLPVTVTNFVVAAATGALLSRVPARYLIGAGLGITGLGLLLTGGVQRPTTGPVCSPASSWSVPAWACSTRRSPTWPSRSCRRSTRGMASGINDTFRQVGIAIGIAAWGAIFLGRGASEVEEVAAGTPAASGARPRELVEAVSSGHLNDAVAAAPPGARAQVADAAHQGFLAGFNDILMLGGIFAVVAAVAAVWLIREDEIEREAPIEVEPRFVPGDEPVPELVAA